MIHSIQKKLVSIKIQTVPYLQLVGHKKHRLVYGGTPDSFVEDVGADKSVDGTERVVQEEYGPLAIEGTRQAHSLTLPSAQVGTSLSNLQRKSKQKNNVP